MQALVDCHVHTARCGHAIGTAAQYAQAAANLGLAGIVFAEHFPLPSALDPDRSVSIPPDTLSDYLSEVASLAGVYPGLEVVAGLEIDWLGPGSGHVHPVAIPTGVVKVGSVHFVDGWAFDNPAELDEWERRDIDRVWESYFALWCDAARSRTFDVMAHPDLPKKFGHRPTFDTRELYAEAANAAAAGGSLIEVSTAGLRKPVGELYPGAELLAAFRTAGVEATIGSDAHSPEEVGYALDAACHALRRAGYGRFFMPLPKGERREIPL